MKMLKINENVPEASAIGLGCMRITGLGSAVQELVEASMEAGVNFFDHADIYAKGEAESRFGEILTPELRSRMVIQTKCAIRPGICYDFSKEHILESVDGSLKRLGTDYIDARVIIGTS